MLVKINSISSENKILLMNHFESSHLQFNDLIRGRSEINQIIFN